MIQEEFLIRVLKLLIKGHVDECHHHGVWNLIDVLGGVKKSLFKCLSFLERHFWNLTLRKMVIGHLNSSVIKVHAHNLLLKLEHNFIKLSTRRHTNEIRKRCLENFDFAIWQNGDETMTPLKRKHKAEK